MKKTYVVDFYWDHHYRSSVVFKHKWQAFLFHILLNKSLDTQGVRRY